MKQKLLQILAFVAVMLVSSQAYAQKEQQTLTLGEFGGAFGTMFDGTNLQNAPMVFFYSHSASQVIYTAEELAQMKGCEISSLSYLAYNSCMMTDEYTSNAKVYLQEVDATEFPKDPVTDKTQWFEVAEGNTVAIALSGLTSNQDGDDVVKFELATPYLYTGKNLVVTIVNDSEMFFDESMSVDALTFYNIPGTGTHRTLIFGSESDDFFTAHKTDMSMLDSEISTNDVPAVQFTYKQAALPEPPAPVEKTLFLGEYENPSDTYQGTMQGAPIFYDYTNCGTQTLYTAEELADMKNSDITSITFKSTVEDCFTEDYSSSLKVYLQEVDAPEFVTNASGKTEWYPVTTPVTEVAYTANFMLESTDYGYGDFEVKIDLTAKPFHYTGKNLIITVVNNDGNQTVQNVFFYCQPVDNKVRTLSFASDRINFDANQAQDNIVNPMGNEQMTSQAPVAKITYLQSALPEPPAVTYPASLYAIGTLKGHAWDGKCTEYALAQDAATPGLYKGNIVVEALDAEDTGYFQLAAIEGATATNWTEYTYAGKNDGDILALDTPTQMWGGYKGEGEANGNSNFFQIKANGRWDVYEITADLRDAENMTVTAKLLSTKPESPIDPTYLKLGEYDFPTDGENCWEGTALNDAPIVFPYCHSGSQVIYTAEQLASIKGEDITSISFKLWATNAYYAYNSTAKIYLNEVDFDTFQKDATDKYRWFDFDENKVIATSVLDIPFYDYTDVDPVEITFDMSEYPYTYNGKNLVVTVVNDAAEAYTADYGTCYFFHVPITKGDPDRTTIFASDDVDFITNQSSDMYIDNQSGNEMTFNYVPVVKIGHSIYTEVEETVVAKQTVTTAAGEIIVNLNEAALVEVYDIAGNAVAVENFEEGINNIKVQNGIYIVKIGNEVHKVCVLN